MLKKFGRITSGIKPAVLRYFYKDLTGKYKFNNHCEFVLFLIILFSFSLRLKSLFLLHVLHTGESTSSNLDQLEIDKRVGELIDMEDSDIVFDLRALNGKEHSQYDTFWFECHKFLNDDVTDAVDDQHHGTITHLAHALSIRNFVEQVKQCCPKETLTPSCEWVRLQFLLKTPSTVKSLHHIGHFNLKFMVPQRQWCWQHMDSHYAAACFQYMKEYAINVRDFCGFISIDDKHRIKIAW